MFAHLTRQPSLHLLQGDPMPYMMCSLKSHIGKLSGRLIKAGPLKRHLFL